jgi:hypothetical protein
MGLPTCSIRALPEHHQLLRRIGRALVTRPDLSETLEALIDGVTQDVTRTNTAMDQRFEDVERRLSQLEAEAVLRSETHAVLPQRDTRDTVPQHDAPAVTRQPAPPTHTPRPPRAAAKDKPSGANGKRRPPRPWTEADDAELRRIFNQGGTQADACREMDRPSSVISPKWWKLAEAKPAEAEAGEGQPPLTLEQIRQIDAMMQAGRSAEEIVTVTGRPIPSREEIKQRLLDENAPPPATTA